MARGIDPPKGGVSSVANKASKDAAKKIAVNNELYKFVNQGKDSTKFTPKHEKSPIKVITDLKLGLEEPKEPTGPVKPKEPTGPGKLSRTTKKLSDETLNKMREGNYDNEPKPQVLGGGGRVN